jgi:hypothetical protein
VFLADSEKYQKETYRRVQNTVVLAHSGEHQKEIYRIFQNEVRKSIKSWQVIEEENLCEGGSD